MSGFSRPAFGSIFAFGGALALGLFLSQPAQAGGGGFIVDDAGVDTPGSCKVEAWGAFMTSDPDDFFGVASPACVVDLGRPVEISGAIIRERSEDVWATGGEVKAKVSVISPDDSPIGIAVVGGYAHDFTESQMGGYFVNVPVTFTINDTFLINVNAGYTHEKYELGNLDLFFWGGGFEWTFYSVKTEDTERSVTLLAEVFGFAGPRAVDEDGVKEPSETRDPRGQIGLRFTPHESFDIDVIYGRNLTGEDKNWVTLGTNIRF